NAGWAVANTLLVIVLLLLDGCRIFSRHDHGWETQEVEQLLGVIVGAPDPTTAHDRGGQDIGQARVRARSPSVLTGGGNKLLPLVDSHGHLVDLALNETGVLATTARVFALYKQVVDKVLGVFDLLLTLKLAGLFVLDQ